MSKTDYLPFEVVADRVLRFMFKPTYFCFRRMDDFITDNEGLSIAYLVMGFFSLILLLIFWVGIVTLSIAVVWP